MKMIFAKTPHLRMADFIRTFPHRVHESEEGTKVQTHHLHFDRIFHSNAPLCPQRSLSECYQKRRFMEFNMEFMEIIF